MVTDSQSYSPSSLKPKYLAERLEKCENVSMESFAPATFGQLILSHAPTYVDDVLSLRIENGFSNKSESVRDALPSIVGAEIAASAYAARNKTITWALCSGFHHANYAHGGGFCTFEGLTIAAQHAMRSGCARHVMIIDGDAHFGDGCVNVIQIKQLSDSVHYLHVGGKLNYEKQVTDFLLEHPQTDLMLFQDGMDAYHLDPIGGGLTYSQLIERTAFIAEICRGREIGLTCNLAGGYLRFVHPDYSTDIEPVLVGHINSVKASASVYGIDIPELSYTLTGPWEKQELPNEGERL